MRIACAGEPAELGPHIVRSAALAGVLNAVLSEHVNLVNAPARAAERGLSVEETTRPRERGIADTVEITVSSAGESRGAAVTVTGTVLYGTTPRLLRVNGIDVESPLEGTILYVRNHDVPGVIGQMGTVLGREGVNISTFALGRREAVRNAEALAIMGLDGEIPERVAQVMLAIPEVTEARLVRLPRGQAASATA
jgi:D-3-phosphoglycerate dehydrogenase